MKVAEAQVFGKYKVSAFSRSFGLLPLSFLVFFFFYQISLAINPSLMSSRFAFVFLMILHFLIKGRFLPAFRYSDFCFFSFLFFLLLYSLFVSAISGVDYIQSSRIFHFILFSLIWPFLLVAVVKNEVLFHKAVLVASLIQVAFVFLTYSSSSFASWLFEYVYLAGDSINRVRAPGLSSSGGAALSVVLSLGAISIVRLSDLSPSKWDLLALLLITSATVLVGRTGLLVSLACFMMIIFRGKFQFGNFVVCFLFFVPIAFLLLDFLQNNKQLFSYTLNWALSVFTGSDRTLEILIHQDFASLTIDRFIFGGTGISNPDGGNASGSDVGYIQTMYALGIPLAFSFYLIYFFYIVGFRVRRADLFFKILLVFMLFFLELKEPFIFKYALSSYVLTSLLFAHRRLIMNR